MSASPFRSRFRARARLAFAATATLVLASGCSGNGEVSGTGPTAARDVPPATREAAGASRESPGATRDQPGTPREPPGTPREPPSGGTPGAPGSGGGGSGGCLACPRSYTCELSGNGQTGTQTIDLVPVGNGECGAVAASGSAIFHCDGSLTLTGDNVGTATGWRSTGNGGFRVLGAQGNVRCSPSSDAP